MGYEKQNFVNGRVLQAEQLNHIEDGLVALDAGKAPAGFGLGRAQSASDKNIDDVTTPGWYHMNKNQTIGGITIAYCYIHVIAHADGASHCTQEVYTIGSTGNKLVRRKLSGVWNEWEWENPPMSLGVEYRTTERWQGKVVYTKLVDCGALPNNNYKNTSTGVEATYIKIVGIATNPNNGNPIVYNMPILSNTGVRARIACLGNNIQTYTTEDLSKYTCQAQIWYTKD